MMNQDRRATRALAAKRASTSGARAAFALDDFVPYLLNQVTCRLNRSMQQHLALHRVSVPQWRVLCLLEIRGPLSIGAIAASTVIAQSTLSRVVDQLERHGLVERRIRPSNNRVVEVHLTAPGRASLRRIRPAALAVRDAVVSPLSAAEHRRLGQLLRKILSRLRRGPAGGGDIAD